MTVPPAPRASRLARSLLSSLVLAAAACTPADAGDTNAAARAALTGWRGVGLPTPLARPSFTLAATDGRPFDFRRDTEGKVALLFFGYTNCPDVCPLHMANVAAALKKMPFSERDQIRMVMVTTDPERDSPEVLRAFLDRFDPTFVGLRGTEDEVAAIQATIMMAPAVKMPPTGPDSTTYMQGHAAQVVAFSKDGPARLLYPFGTRQEDWLADLPKLARGEVVRDARAARTVSDSAAPAHGGH